MSIFISNKGQEKWLESTGFEKEEDLQKYITNKPNSIPIPNLKIISREFFTSHRERIDHIGIDQNGEIYLIETKHYTNPDKRHIVSQVLDYGATLASDYNFEDFKNQVEDWIRKNTSANSLLEFIQQNYTSDKSSAEEIVEDIERNFSAKKFKFIVLMDHIDDKIKKLVNFLNDYSTFSIFLIEYRRYVDDNVEIIIPTLYGTENIRKSKSTANWNWTEDDFLDNIEFEQQLNEQQKQIIRKFISSIKELLKNPYGGEILWDRRKNPTFITIFYRYSQSKYFLAIQSDGIMKLNFEFSNDQEQKFSDSFRNLLIKIKGLEIIEKKYSNKEKIVLNANEWTPVADEIADVVKKVCFEENHD